MSASIKLRPGLLDRLRRRFGFPSDEALASIIGVDASTLADLDRGEAPSVRIIALLADVLGLPLSEVACLEPPAGPGLSSSMSMDPQ